MQYKRAEAREGGCIGMNKGGRGVCLPGRSTGRHCSLDRYSGTVSGAGPIEKDGADNQYSSICDNMMHEHGM